ncbi:unnamed protein product [Sphagnum jensenii]|uniref:Secreted protein n=1 Tax=Sphagnum jensenii TaxID=128206 RepID=A0ABP0VTW3_9BRYO
MAVALRVSTFSSVCTRRLVKSFVSFIRSLLSLALPSCRDFSLVLRLPEAGDEALIVKDTSRVGSPSWSSTAVVVSGTDDGGGKGVLPALRSQVSPSLLAVRTTQTPDGEVGSGKPSCEKRNCVSAMSPFYVRDEALL